MLLEFNLKKRDLTMRTYDEMTENVFSRIHEYNEKKNKNKKMFRRISVFCGICIISAVGLYIWNSNFITKPNDQKVITGGFTTSDIDLIIIDRSYIIIESDANNYTKDKFIGFANDFEIIDNKLIEKDEEIFTVKENNYNLLLISSNGKTRLLIDIDHVT